MVIASQAFTALIPLLLVTSALASGQGDDVVADALINRLSLTGSSAEAVRQVFAHSEPASVGLPSVVLLLFSAVSFTRRVQRMYMLAWSVEDYVGVRGSVNAASGLAALLLEAGLLYLATAVLRQLSLGWALAALLSVLPGLLVWTTIPWLLLDRRVAWRRLLPGGAVSGVCTSLYGVATSIYMPRLIVRYSETYGLFGVTLALVGWLLCMSLILEVSAVIAAELDHSQGTLARHVRRRLRTEAGGVDKALTASSSASRSGGWRGR
ncbi:MAG: YhjD/YihY/BrkB family envelope integrity protein [Nocardioidaceae bacterium]